MKTLRKKRLPKKIIVVSAVALLLAAGILTYIYTFNGNLFGWKASQNTIRKTNSVDYGPATPEQKAAGRKAKSGSSETPPAPTPIPGSDKKNVQVTITNPNPIQNGSVVQIRTQIGAVEDTGVCTLTLTSPGRATVKKTASTQPLASTSTCQGFDIPVSELSAGTWHALVEYSSSTLTGSAATDIVIK